MSPIFCGFRGFLFSCLLSSKKNFSTGNKHCNGECGCYRDQHKRWVISDNPQSSFYTAVKLKGRRQYMNIIPSRPNGNNLGGPSVQRMPSPHFLNLPPSLCQWQVLTFQCIKKLQIDSPIIHIDFQGANEGGSTEMVSFWMICNNDHNKDDYDDNDDDID